MCQDDQDGFLGCTVPVELFLYLLPPCFGAWNGDRGIDDRLHSTLNFVLEGGKEACKYMVHGATSERGKGCDYGFWGQSRGLSGHGSRQTEPGVWKLQDTKGLDGHLFRFLSHSSVHHQSSYTLIGSFV